MSTLCALISVYQHSDPHELNQALTSLVNQTRPADSIIIVEDGPLTNALEQVLNQHIADNPTSRRIRLATNQGLGAALRAGLQHIDTEFVARLDTDDIAAPHRFETQLALFETHPELDVVGSAVAEFTDQPGDSTTIRALPETHDGIARYMKINNPINHPSVMMRVRAVKQAGGYRDVHFMEDYDLFARMLAGGSRFHNITEALTYLRVSDAQFARRTSKGMWRSEKTMQTNLVRYGIISKPRAIANFIIRSTYRLLPQQVLKKAYGILFHKK
ncbi:MAG: glycosyltransferase [Corynebacterium sp.]|uniref:glycosyltransferase n=1 Tax=Corynebacterium sp. TaxID=1720 RepID=UPI0026DAE118|nr:glycosyltransferase [Corynebacterium sp.]MDO4762294.1 glycosyltransferase [Corynebacterium sp.]